MDEGRRQRHQSSLLVIFVGCGVAILQIQNLVRNRVLNSTKYGYNISQPPPPPPSRKSSPLSGKSPPSAENPHPSAEIPEIQGRLCLKSINNGFLHFSVVGHVHGIHHAKFCRNRTQRRFLALSRKSSPLSGKSFPSGKDPPPSAEQQPLLSGLNSIMRVACVIGGHST